MRNVRNVLQNIFLKYFIYSFVLRSRTEWCCIEVYRKLNNRTYIFSMKTRCIAGEKCNLIRQAGREGSDPSARSESARNAFSLINEFKPP